jgi:hypothetical protein
MTDTTAHDIGDRVRVSLADDDAESRFEDRICRVVHRFTRDPETPPQREPEQEREMDRAAYRLEDVETGQTLPVIFRHRDLVPATDD